MNPYIEEIIPAQIILKWNPDYDQEAICQCGHPYYRHFDSYDNNEPVGCKYCSCRIFKRLEWENIKKLFEFKNAVLDALNKNCILGKEHYSNPELAVKDLIDWEVNHVVRKT